MPTCILSVSVCVDVDVIRVWMARIATKRGGKDDMKGGGGLPCSVIAGARVRGSRTAWAHSALGPCL